ncbi:MAG: carbonic anhydrase [Pseudomonadota bacterium]|nr:carbonic anhydrase [Pseudomonadota bacterium]
MIDDLLNANKIWAAAKTKADPDFFMRLVAQQSPEYLWIGCSDSRVPANEIVGRDPGEMFVHRNVANLCTPSDLNFLSVLQYAVDVLKVRRILVVGHYGCGGVLASLGAPTNGLVDHWLGPVRALAAEKKAELDAISDKQARHDRLVELTVLRQVELLHANPIIVNARARGQAVGIHGWVYSIRDGLVRDQHAPSPPGTVDPGPSNRPVGMESDHLAALSDTPVAVPISAPQKRGLFGRPK